MPILRNRGGLGMLELLITLSIIVAISYFMMKRQTGASLGSPLQSAQKRLEAQGIQVPAQISLGTQVQKIGEEREKAMDCSTAEATGCRVDAPAH